MSTRDVMQMALDAMVSFEGGTNGLFKGEFAEEITALRAALEQPEQDPVAYFDFQQLKFTWAKHMKIGPVPVSIKVEPLKLYTAPPQRKPLTIDELRSVLDSCEDNRIAVARAIEQAHDIGEKP